MNSHHVVEWTGSVVPQANVGHCDTDMAERYYTTVCACPILSSRKHEPCDGSDVSSISPVMITKFWGHELQLVQPIDDTATVANSNCSNHSASNKRWPHRETGVRHHFKLASNLTSCFSGGACQTPSTSIVPSQSLGMRVSPKNTSLGFPSSILESRLTQGSADSYEYRLSQASANSRESRPDSFRWPHSDLARPQVTPVHELCPRSFCAISRATVNEFHDARPERCPWLQSVTESRSPPMLDWVGLPSGGTRDIAGIDCFTALATVPLSGDNTDQSAPPFNAATNQKIDSLCMGTAPANRDIRSILRTERNQKVCQAP